MGGRTAIAPLFYGPTKSKRQLARKTYGQVQSRFWGIVVKKYKDFEYRVLKFKYSDC
jgi:hypothetical protein